MKWLSLKERSIPSSKTYESWIIEVKADALHQTFHYTGEVPLMILQHHLSLTLLLFVDGILCLLHAYMPH